MNKYSRRDFIKSSSVLGTAALGTGMIANSCSDESGQQDMFTFVEPLSNLNEIEILENNYLKVSVFNNGAIVAFDKVNKQEWKTYSVAIQDEKEISESMLWGRSGRGMGEQYPGRFIGEKTGEHLRFKIHDRQNICMGSFVCKFELSKEWLSLKLIEIDESLPSLVYPPPFESDALVLPVDGGKLLKNNSSSIYSGIYNRQFLQFFNHLSMRMIAGLKENNGWLCAYNTKSMDSGAMLINGQVTPAWVKSMGKWQGHYQVQYTFTSNNYVGIAKKYRQHAMEQGFFKSLKEKIEENPEAGKLLGGRALQFMNFKSKGYPETKDEYWAHDKQVDIYKKDHINFTFKDVKDKVKIAEEKLGFNKGMILLRGWMHGGYDSTHPDIWPIETKLGSERELKELMGNYNNYVTVLHDNYQDFYPTTPSFPNGVIVRENGKLMSAGLWFGKQCYLTNSRDSVRFAKKNWEKVKTLGSTGYFIDTTPCNPLTESYEKGNEQTRLQDMQYKHDLLKIFYDEKQVVGSEKFGDFCVPVMHWSEHTQKRVQGESIPLWQLVFHDTMFMCRYDVFDRKTPYPSWIEDMFYGNFLRFWIPTKFGGDEPYNCEYLTGWGNWDFTEDEFKNTYHVDKWHEKIGLEEMTSHSFLSEDMKVEEVIYGDKFRMTVNFDNKPRKISNKTYKAYEYSCEG